MPVSVIDAKTMLSITALLKLHDTKLLGHWLAIISQPHSKNNFMTSSRLFQHLSPNSWLGPKKSKVELCDFSGLLRTRVNTVFTTNKSHSKLANWTTSKTKAEYFILYSPLLLVEFWWWHDMTSSFIAVKTERSTTTGGVLKPTFTALLQW